MLYQITGFGNDSDRERFMQLIEFAVSGRVIIGWEDVPAEERDEDAEWDYNQRPVYNDSDRSGDEHYPLAYALSLTSVGDISGCDDGSLLVRAHFDQDEIVQQAGRESTLLNVRLLD